MSYKDKHGKPIVAYEILDAKGKVVTVTASWGDADLYVNGSEGEWFEKNAARLKLNPKEYPPHAELKIRTVK